MKKGLDGPLMYVLPKSKSLFSQITVKTDEEKSTKYYTSRYKIIEIKENDCFVIELKYTLLVLYQV